MSRIKKTISLLLIFTMSLSLFTVGTAFADEEVTADTPMPDIEALLQDVDAASAVYDDAKKRISELEKEIADTDERILEIQSQMPEARKISNEAAREYYVLLSNNYSLLEIFLGATSMEDFFSKIEYTARINQSYLSDIVKLSTLEDELEAARDALEEKKATVEAEQLRAEEALFDAQNAHAVAEETAQKIVEATAAATAAAAEEAAAIEHTPEAPVTPTNPGSTTPGVSTPETPSEKQDFVNLWAPRIDAYLAGSPLGGYGYAFASAAYDYNVDPRWSPAIACLESGKGSICFRSHNAWGWGSVDWPDWETAIYGHIRGLSIGYGYTISEANAKKYCPPNWEHWYTFVSTQMSYI